MNRKYSTLIDILLFVVLSLVATVRADYPDPNDQYINDYANLIDSYDRSVIRDMFINLEKETGKQAVVVTIDSIYDYETDDRTIESFATNLFNKWGVGNKKSNDGVMILVARSDRKCRIELGGGYGRKYDSAMKNVIDKHMLPHFRRDKYSLGIREGAIYSVDRVQKEISWFSSYKWYIILGFLGGIFIIACISYLISGSNGFGGWFFRLLNRLIGSTPRSRRRPRSRYAYYEPIYGGGGGSSGGGSFGGGFGGGSSFGGGASGSW